MTQLSQAMNFSFDLQEEGVCVKNQEALGSAMKKHITKYNVAGMDGNQLFFADGSCCVFGADEIKIVKNIDLSTIECCRSMV